MGDFRGSDVPSEGMFNTNGTFQFLDGMSSSDRDQIKDLLGINIKKIFLASTGQLTEF